ncbi:hypothetical protein Q5762_32605 [Streptomyces sp. P9(2023)]|nr:hypothetical protein [Streptomyces sp. P9(2023)]MDT9692981.1 hypothetical protein [Streptomyces sp. P9(2023)]
MTHPEAAPKRQCLAPEVGGESLVRLAGIGMKTERRSGHDITQRTEGKSS